MYGFGSSRTKSPTTVDIAYDWLNVGEEQKEVIIHVYNAYLTPDVRPILYNVSISDLPVCTYSVSSCAKLIFYTNN
jgi:hypothetical protein